MRNLSLHLGTRAATQLLSVSNLNLFPLKKVAGDAVASPEKSHTKTCRGVHGCHVAQLYACSPCQAQIVASNKSYAFYLQRAIRANGQHNHYPDLTAMAYMCRRRGHN